MLFPKLSFSFKQLHRKPAAPNAGEGSSPLVPRQAAHDEASEAKKQDVEAVAGAIEASGLVVPAALALQIARPLSWFGGQALWALQPFIEGLGLGARRGPFSVPGLAGLLERDGGLDELIVRLETGVGPAGGVETAANGQER